MGLQPKPEVSMEQALKALEALKKESVVTSRADDASPTLNSGLVAAAAAAHYLNTCLYPHAAAAAANLTNSSPISASEAAVVASLFSNATSASSPLSNVINNPSVHNKEDTTNNKDIPSIASNSISPVVSAASSKFTAANDTSTTCPTSSNMSPVTRLAVAADLLPFLNFGGTSPSTAASLTQQQTNSNMLTAAALLGAMGNASALGSMGLDASTATAMLQLAYASNLQSQLNCSPTAMRAVNQISNVKVSLSVYFYPIALKYSSDFGSRTPRSFLHILID